jgi:hypothetical protein
MQTEHFTVEGRDRNGNVSVCTTVITVKDTISPVFNLVNSIVVDTEPGQSTTKVDYPAVNASDNCSVEIMQLVGLGPGEFFPEGPTTEVYLAKDLSGNTDTLAFTITVNVVDNPSASAAVDLSGIIRVYPNPTSGWIRVEMDDCLGFIHPEIEIYSIGGNKMLQRKMDKSPLSIDISRYTEGIYFLRIKAEGIDVLKRVVKARGKMYVPD